MKKKNQSNAIKNTNQEISFGLPRILFICPDISEPSGGVKQIYRQVDILNLIGYDASVIHKNIGFRAKWFENKTSIKYNYSAFLILDKEYLGNSRFTIRNIYSRLVKKNKAKNDFQINSNDILVFPEFYGVKINEVFILNKKVIYNQGCYLTFKNHPVGYASLDTPYLKSNVIATLVNSNDGLAYMKYVFPNHHTIKIRHFIDCNLFIPSKFKKKQVAFMSRKNYEDVRQVINIFCLKNKSSNWDFIDINGNTHSQVAKILSESSIFLSSNGDEGFALPSIEAMAAGCLVVGYTGKGGKEYFKKDFSIAVEEKNVQEFALKFQEAIETIESNPKYLYTISQLARNFIKNNYSQKNEVSDVENAWQKILSLDKSN